MRTLLTHVFRWFKYKLDDKYAVQIKLQVH